MGNAIIFDFKPYSFDFWNNCLFNSHKYYNPKIGSLDLDFVAYRGNNFEALDGIRTFSFDTLREESDSNFSTKREEIIEKAQTDDAVNIQFTSGTTGHPKGATLTHHNILNNALSVSADIRLNLTEKDSILLNVPFYHCFGCVVGTLVMALRGTRMVVPARVSSGTNK